MGIKYSQLGLSSRIIIEYLLEQAVCPARIARHIRTDRSTVCRELRRGWHIALGQYTLGHWEGDLIKGAHGQSCIATLVERASRLVLLVRLRSAHSDEVCRAIIKRTRHMPPHLRRSLTYDRGTEMAQHHTLTAQLNMPVFFCSLYSPWQRGSNENTNGLLRQYLPKGMDLSTVTAKQLRRIESRINTRPRRMFGCNCAQEVLDTLRAQ